MMPRRKSRVRKTRVTLELPDQVRRRLDELQVISGADSMTEVVRRALHVYDQLIQMTVEKEGKISIRFPDDSETQVIIA